MREAAIVKDGVFVNAIVLPDGPEGDALLSETCVEITDLDPKPGLGLGWTYADGAFVPPPTPPQTWDEIRAERDRLLTASDWTRMDDAPLSDAERQAWADYRQALRDIPQTQDDPNNIVWPTAP